MICQQCKLIHSDWLSCEQAKALNEFREPTEEVLDTLPVVCGVEKHGVLPTETTHLVSKKRGWPKGKPRKATR